MCKFTILSYLCGHHALLCAPENTLLCQTARLCGLRQGLDRAPSSCHALPDDIYEESQIAIRNHEFLACESCRFRSQYTTFDSKLLEDFAEHIVELGNIGVDTIRLLEQREDLRVNIKQIPHTWFRSSLLQLRHDMFGYSLMDELRQVWEWMPYLTSLIHQDVPRETFDSTLKWVSEKAAHAERKLQTLVDIVELLSQDHQVGEWPVKMWKLGEELRVLYYGDHTERYGVGRATISAYETNHDDESEAMYISDDDNEIGEGEIEEISSQASTLARTGKYTVSHIESNPAGLGVEMLGAYDHPLNSSGMQVAFARWNERYGVEFWKQPPPSATRPLTISGAPSSSSKPSLEVVDGLEISRMNRGSLDDTISYVKTGLPSDGRCWAVEANASRKRPCAEFEEDLLVDQGQTQGYFQWAWNGVKKLRFG